MASEPGFQSMHIQQGEKGEQPALLINVNASYGYSCRMGHEASI